jgi:cadaverine:lysine antiporter
MHTPPLKKLGWLACTCVVMGNMIGSGILLLPASLANFGFTSLIGWLAVVIGVVCLALVFSLLATQSNMGGGIMGYAERLSPVLGFQTRTLYYHANWIGNLAVAWTGVSYLSIIWTPLQKPWLATLATILVVWLFTGITALNGRWISRWWGVAAGLILLPLLVTAIWGWHDFSLVQYQQNAAHSPPMTLSSVGHMVLLLLWAFIGIESSVVSSDMVKRPNWTLPLATVLGTLCAAVLYILASQVLLGLYPILTLQQGVAPFALSAGKLLGAWAVPIVAIFTAISCFSALGAWIFLVAEAGRRAALAGDFPAWLGETDANGITKKGLFAAATMMTVFLPVLVWRLGSEVHLSQVFSWLISLAVLLTVLPYFYSTVALWQRVSMSPWHWSALVTLVAMSFCFLILLGAPSGLLSMVFIVALLSVVYYAKRHC